MTITKYSNIVYSSFQAGDGSTVSLGMDVYVPSDGATSHPALMMIHGDGWADGTKSDIATKAKDYANLGFTTFAPDYRESCDPANPAPGDNVQLCGYLFPVPLIDLRAALVFIRNQAGANPKWKANPSFVGIWGSSSGGNLAGSLATDGWESACQPTACAPGVAGQSKPDAIIAWSPAMNLVDGTGDPVQDGRVQQYLGCNPYATPSTCPAGLTAEASPLYNITPDDAPAFLSGSQTDQITPYTTQIAPMAQALAAAGIDEQLYQVAGNCHGLKCTTPDPYLEANSANWEHAHLDAARPVANISSSPLHPSQADNATFTFTAPGGMTANCALDGGAPTPCTSGVPVTFTGLQPANHVFSVQVTDTSGSGSTGAASTITWSIKPLVNSIADSGYSPASIKGPQGVWMTWKNNGTVQHTATDKSGMGYFDTGALAPGATSGPCLSGQQGIACLFPAAGTYYYQDSMRTTSQGNLKINMVTSATTGPAGSSFLIQWADEAPPTGYVYDVQWKKPGTTSFVNLFTNLTTTQASIPLPLTGQYQFRSHMKKISGGTAAGWSPTLTITTS